MVLARCPNGVSTQKESLNAIVMTTPFLRSFSEVQEKVIADHAKICTLLSCTAHSDTGNRSCETCFLSYRVSKYKNDECIYTRLKCSSVVVLENEGDC